MNRITHFKTAEMEKNSNKEEIIVVLLPLKSYFSWRLQKGGEGLEGKMAFIQLCANHTTEYFYLG